MGDRPVPNMQRSQESTLGSTAASQLPEDDDDTRLTENLGIRGASLPPGRIPVVRDSDLGTSETVGAHNAPISHLTEEQAAEAALNDEQAKAFGPLTEAALHEERARSRLDPRHPRRPLRYLEVGDIEPDSEQFKFFRKFALENDFPSRISETPDK
jgi:hypothetical protein